MLYLSTEQVLCQKLPVKNKLKLWWLLVGKRRERWSKPSVFCTFPGGNVRESNKRDIRGRSAAIIYNVSARISPEKENGMLIASVL